MPNSPLATPSPLFQDTSATDYAVLRARIEALHADYAGAIDADRLEDWPQFFTPDAIYRVITRENRERGLPVSLIYASGRGMLTDRITALRTANIYEPHVYCHTGGALRILGREGAAWRVESNFAIVRSMASGSSGLFVAGRYIDAVVEVDGQLLLAQRTVVLDSRQIDTLLVIPI